MSPQQKYTSKLAGTAILVVGGTSGLGFGVAEASIEYNAAHVYISSSSSQKVDTAISRLKASYPDTETHITGIVCNLGDEASLEENVAALFAKIDGKLDHIVFTAGEPLSPKPIADIDVAFMRKAGVVRFLAPYFISKHGVKHLNPGPASSITITSGSVAEKPNLNWTVVASYAAGLHGMIRALALELKPVRVNLISPGGVETELWESILGSREAAQRAIGAMHARSTTGKIGSVEDVVESFLYVMKDKNVTGTVIRSDGGAFLL
ncbi:hypothetical protein LTR84_011822 [Exophiala bonariae]|uniref:NAD(P)-binding protein n=1 Tax=Exophiala bonariae TaxID=1690606 RepID=A0AAV9NHH3_9EURO|nr:hypothetical protein LTR84_011822 [Exophiala bonariae]